MIRKPLIFIKTGNGVEFCDNRCNNKECSKHLSKLPLHRGFAVIKKMRNTPECEGYISKWKQSHEEIEQIKKEMKEAGVKD